MNVLRRAVGIVARHHGVNFVARYGIERQLRPISVALHVITAVMIGVPDVDSSSDDGLAPCIQDFPRDDQRNAWIAGGAQVLRVWRMLFKERSENIFRSWLRSVLLTLLPQGQ